MSMLLCLAELLFRVKSHSYLPSNNGTLFMWWSPGSGPLTTGRWIQRDVVLPIPADIDDEGTQPHRPTPSTRIWSSLFQEDAYVGLTFSKGYWSVMILIVLLPVTVTLRLML